jgi:cytosine/adenosine deaminase-related metal-dependent hydrolase
VLCYEVTDRHGKAGREAGLKENRRYLQRPRDGRFAGLMGAHASFTLDDDAMSAFVPAVHIHVAEDPCDERITRERYGKPLLQRLQPLLHPDSIFAHCIHLDDNAIAAINAAQVTIAHNPRSNMNNAVGYAPIAKLTCPIMLGTDGIGGDMFAESKAAWFKSRDGGGGISPADVIAMLAHSARRASLALGTTLGKLQTGAAADVVITDYAPSTPLTTQNVPGHFIFAMSARNVRHVIAAGKIVLRNRIVQTCSEQAIRVKTQAVAADLWKRMESIQA